MIIRESNFDGGYLCDVIYLKNGDAVVRRDVLGTTLIQYGVYTPCNLMDGYGYNMTWLELGYYGDIMHTPVDGIKGKALRKLRGAHKFKTLQIIKELFPEDFF